MAGLAPTREPLDLSWIADPAMRAHWAATIARAHEDNRAAAARVREAVTRNPAALALVQDAIAARRRDHLPDDQHRLTAADYGLTRSVR